MRANVYAPWHTLCFAVLGVDGKVTILYAEKERKKRGKVSFFQGKWKISMKILPILQIPDQCNAR